MKIGTRLIYVYSVAALLVLGLQASAAAHPLDIKGSFADYAFSKDYNSFDPKESRNAKRIENGDGLVPRIAAKLDNAVSISAASCQTILTVPMGWYAMDQGEQTTIYSPDERTRFILHVADISPAKTFAEFKRIALKTMENQLHQPEAKFTQFDMPDGSFAVEIRDIRTASGNKNGMVIVYTANPGKKGIGKVMSMSLTSPMQDFSKYEGLAGLLLKSRKILW